MLCYHLKSTLYLCIANTAKLAALLYNEANQDKDCHLVAMAALNCIMMYELCVAPFGNVHLINRSLIFVRIIINGYHLELASSLCRPLNQPPNSILAYESG